MRRKNEKMSKKREYEKKKRDYENKKLFKIQKGKKTRILQKMHIATPKISLNKLHSIKMFFSSGIVFTLLILQDFSNPDYWCKNRSGTRVPILCATYTSSIHPPPDACNEEDEGDD